MGEPANGHWPPNVTAKIITKEEKEALLRASQPAVVSTPGAVTSTIISAPIQQTTTPSETNQPMEFDEEQIQETSNYVVGRAALKVARQLGLDHVWSTETKKPISILAAETLARKNPGFVYFDFDAMAEENEARGRRQSVGELDQTEYTGDGDDLGDEIEEAEAEIDDLDDDGLDDELLPPEALPPVETFVPQSQPIGHITEREIRAFGGTLSYPGIQVYVHPNGITRVEVEGPIKLQKAVNGNTRILRMQRVTVQQNIARPIPSNVTRRTIQGSNSPSPNPEAQFRRVQGVVVDHDKRPAVQGPRTRIIDESEF